jgi:hypothetical protein
MIEKVFTKAYRFSRLASSCGGSLLAVACAMPSLNVVPTLPTAPTIPQLETHLTCALVRAMDRHLNPTLATSQDPAKAADYALWRHLIDYNFLGTINLTLFVTQTQGLNPSLNFITPLTNLGDPIKTIVESSNGTTSVQNATMNTNNLTLAVGFQLTGMQDRNFVQTYIVDVHRLYNAMYPVDQNGKEATSGGLLDTCDDRGDGSHAGLKGDLELEATLKSGLEGLQVMPYTPVTVGSAPASKASQQASSASVSQSAGASSFSEKIDFSLLWGVNGGPSWSLLKFKGPGGGGSGASGQLLSYSRQKQDTLISTFSATCKTDKDIDLEDPALYLGPTPQPLSSGPDFVSYQFVIYRRIPPELGRAPDTATSEELDRLPEDKQSPHANEKYIVTIAIPADKTKLPITYTSTATGTLTVETLGPPHPGEPSVRNAIIAWSAFGPVPDHYSLRGIVSDAQSGTSVGYIYASLIPDGKLTKLGSLRISRNALDAIGAEYTSGPPDYWASLPSCSNSGPFLPNGLNVLQQLPGDVSSALQQQR